MFIAFISVLGAVLLIYILSRGRYAQMMDEAEDSRFRFKELLPVGLYILEISGYRYSTGYDKRLLSAIMEITEPKLAHNQLKLHWANKILSLLSAFLFAAFVGVFSKPDAGFVIFAAAIIAGAFYFTDKELFDRVKMRRASIRLDFPDFVSKLMLLINAGLTVPRAWERIASDTAKNTPLYRELRLALQDIKSGKPEHCAYEEFAKRCRTPEITRFISVILQNQRKGNAEIVPLLRVFAMECWEMRKNTARRFGEEASTKMLLPLMLMFLAILLIVGTPAVLALRNI